MKWLLIAMIVIPGTMADVLNTMGMKRHGQVTDFRPRALLRLMVRWREIRILSSACRRWRYRSLP